jgi:hypothetical protein
LADIGERRRIKSDNLLIPESVTPERRSVQAIDSYLLAKNWGEPMGAPAIFEKQIEIRLLPPASTLESQPQVNVMTKNADLLTRDRKR